MFIRVGLNEYDEFLNRSIWAVDTGTPTPGQSGSGSNGNEGVFLTT